MKTTSVGLVAFLQAIYVSISPVVAQSSPGIHCSLPGYDRGIESFMSTTDGTYLGCSNACYQQSNCKMFAYMPPGPGATDGDCQLYDTLIAKNWILDETSPYYFWDNGCETVIKKCNYLGVDRFFGPIANADTSSLPADQQSLQACRTRCTINPSCKAYAWTETSCTFYDVPVSGNFLYGDGTQSVSRFYDLACTVTTSSTTKSTTTTTNAVTTLKTSTKAQTTTTTPAKTSTKAQTTTTTSTKKIMATTTAKGY